MAWLLYPLRGDVFADELRVLGRLSDQASPEQVAWTKDYLSHPRYSKGTLARRLGLRCRVSLLAAWAKENGITTGPAESFRPGAQMPSSGK
ncbi:MAG: hypothetical protein WCR07_15570 [Verrucomicrobiota bacterium]